MPMQLPPDALFSVTEFLDFTNALLEPVKVSVVGEITSWKNGHNGHAYFDLSDDSADQKAVMSCAIWKFRRQRLPFEPEVGMKVQVTGQANIYKPNGRFSYIVEQMAPVGAGQLQQAFEKLKKKLQQAGYFEVDRKQSLPAFPEKIGVVTADRSDALKDFVTHVGQYGLSILHRDARVEGLAAVDSIVSAIEWFNRQSQPVELLVVTRGGGSAESLQAFNTEAVALAIAASKIPIVSAVGHENDTTIADLVADARASTPTDAGKLVSAQWRQATEQLPQLRQQLLAHFERQLGRTRFDFQRQAQKMFDVWLEQLSAYRRTIEQFRRNGQLFVQQLQHQKAMLDTLQATLRARDPQQLVKLGYVIARTPAGQIVRHVEQLAAGDQLDLSLQGGTAHTTVTTISNRKDSQ